VEDRPTPPRHLLPAVADGAVKLLDPDLPQVETSVVRRVAVAFVELAATV
jgi:hypothetical protein